MENLRDALRADIAEQFELPIPLPSAKKSEGKGFVCIPNGYDHCEECFKLGLYPVGKTLKGA